ncbi:MAG: hypothetical protein Q7R78_01565 [bacterium]|nr:hypothetical protein [bacterium]
MKKIFAFLGFFAPVITMAQVASAPITGTLSNADDVVGMIIRIFNVAIYVLISAAVVYLVWLIVKYFLSASDSEKKGAILSQIGFGILGLFIILSIWGLVNILVRTFNFGNNNVPTDRIPRAIINR